MLARRGSDLSTCRFAGEQPRFTHTALAVREHGEWWVHHLLNTHGGPLGHLYRQPLIDFFRDDPMEYAVSVLVPSTALQRKIVRVLGSPLREGLYNPSYSRVAYPYSTRYQNSNQWIAEIVVAAQAEVSSRVDAQCELRSRGLRPDVLLDIGPVRQLASYWLTRNTRLDDHPARNRLGGRFEFLLEPSLRHYLCDSDAVRAMGELSLGSTPSQDSTCAPSA